MSGGWGRRGYGLILFVLTLGGCSHADVPRRVAPSSAPARSAVVEAAPLRDCSEEPHAPRPEPPCTADQPPEPRSRVAPNYPSRAREARVAGVVRLQALVCEHGAVVDVRVVDSIPLLDDAAIEALKQWTFEPARKGGVAVPCWNDRPIRFTLH